VTRSINTVRRVLQGEWTKKEDRPFTRVSTKKKTEKSDLGYTSRGDIVAAVSGRKSSAVIYWTKGAVTGQGGRGKREVR